jgi:HK97 family phage major capsid protein
MPDKLKALEGTLEIIKSMKTEIVALKEQGKTFSESMEKKVEEMVKTREQAIKDDVIQRFRKGEHLEPHQGEGSEDGNPFLIQKGADGKTREMMEFNDNVLIISKMLRVHPTQTKIWRKNQAQATEIRKAMSAGASGSGADWVPTEFSSDLIDKYRLSLKVGNLFRMITMPSNPYKLPTVASDATAYKVSESTVEATEAGRITASTPGSSSVTLTATKLAARTVVSEEMQEDSIIPALPFIKDNLARVMGDAWETVLINGDTRTVGNMDIDVTAASDKKTAANGVRRRAQVLNTLVALTTFNLAGLRSMRTTMGRYGVNPAELCWITGPKGYAKLLGLDEVTTLEKYGPGATILNGELGRLDGIPIVVSEHVREDLSTTGYYDVTTTDNTVIILVNKTCFVQGQKRKMTLKTFEEIQTDQTVMVVTMRHDFQPIYSGVTDQICQVGRDVATS